MATPGRWPVFCWICAVVSCGRGRGGVRDRGEREEGSDMSEAVDLTDTVYDLCLFSSVMYHTKIETALVPVYCAIELEG
jgi:hypothetical protein